MTVISAIAVHVSATARITVTDPTAGAEMTIWRRISGSSQRNSVMGLAEITPTAGVWVDPEIPLGVSVVYEVEIDHTVEATSQDVILAGPPIIGMNGKPGAIISDPLKGLIAPVVILADTLELQMRSRSTAVDVETQRERVIISERFSAATCTPVFLAETTDAVEALTKILEAGTPWLLRTPCTKTPGGWRQTIGDVQLSPLVAGSDVCRVSIGETQIIAHNPNAEIRAVDDTLGDLYAVMSIQPVNTLAGIAEMWSTLADIAAEDLKGRLS